MEPPHLKVVLVGDAKVGKTALIHSFTHKGELPSRYEPTSFDQTTHSLVVEGRVFQITLWDTAGREEHSALRKLAFPETDVFVLVFRGKGDMERLEAWAKELEPHNTGNAPLVLAWNRENPKHTLTPDETKLLTSKSKAARFCTVNAALGTTTKALFNDVVRTAIDSDRFRDIHAEWCAHVAKEHMRSPLGRVKSRRSGRSLPATLGATTGSAIMAALRRRSNPSSDPDPTDALDIDMGAPTVKFGGLPPLEEDLADEEQVVHVEDEEAAWASATSSPVPSPARREAESPTPDTTSEGQLPASPLMRLSRLGRNGVISPSAPPPSSPSNGGTRRKSSWMGKLKSRFARRRDSSPARLGSREGSRNASEDDDDEDFRDLS